MSSDTDLSSIPGLAYDEIALHGERGICINLLWKRLENLFDIELEEGLKTFIWDELVKMECLNFFLCPRDVNEPFQNLPKVLYNNEKTLAILENSEHPGHPSVSDIKRDSSWENVTARVKLESFEKIESNCNSLRIVAKHPELSQLHGYWDPLIPLPSKCSVLVNYLSRVGSEGSLSCGHTSPLNAAIGVKSTTIFHVKKISKLYNLVRWRKILVKKARLSRNTTSGACAVLPRFVSPTFLLPDRMITIAKQLADFIMVKSPINKTVEARHCLAELGWRRKQFCAVLNGFSEYFLVSYTKSGIADSAGTDAENIEIGDSDESKFSFEETKSSLRVYKTITLQKPIALSLSTAKKGISKYGDDEDAISNPDETSMLEEEKDDEGESINSSDNTELSQLFVARSPLRTIWQKIAATGSKGITLQDLRTIPNLGIIFSSVRRSVKLLVIGGCIKWVHDQSGRQHVKRYFATTSGESLYVPSDVSLMYGEVDRQQRKRSSPDSLSMRSNSPAPSIATTTRTHCSATLVASHRKQVIDSSLQDRKALLLSELASKLRRVDDKAMGSVDRRTVQRLCNELISDGRINSFSMPLKNSQGTVTVYTAFGVVDDDEAVIAAVNRRDRCVKPVACPVSDDNDLICGLLRIRQVNTGRVALQYPKMQRIEMLHQFLWFLVYGKGETSKLTGHLAQCAGSIGKISNHEEMPPGWMRLSAVLDAMPLYLLAFICPVALAILSPSATIAAINGGLTFSQLAPDLRASALHTWGSFSLAGELREQLLVLNTICLVTFLDKRSHSTSHLRTCLYVHERTSVCPLPLSPSSGSEPAIDRKIRAFEKFEDVAAFWADLRNESLLSTPALRKSTPATSEERKPTEKTKRSRLSELSRLSVSVPTFDAVPYVRAKPLGDQNGPASCDSRIRLNISAHWHICKWAPIPWLDEVNHNNAITLRRRTKLMALAGNFRRRRRKGAMKSLLEKEKENSEDDKESGTSKVTTRSKEKRKISSSVSSIFEQTRRSSSKRVKKDAPKSKPTDKNQPATRRRRPLIRQPNPVQNVDATEGIEESGKMYKTLQTLIDTLAVRDAQFMASTQSKEENNPHFSSQTFTERDIATLALLVFHACVVVSNSPYRLNSSNVPSFQDIRRAVVFPTLEIPNRGWVSHAVDLLANLYPHAKQTSLVFQFVLTAVDLILSSDVDTFNPESKSAMKTLWKDIYESRFKTTEFMDLVFRKIHSKAIDTNSTRIISETNLNKLHIISKFWGKSSNDLWSRLELFMPFVKSGSNPVEDENRIRGEIAEQTMSAFLICTRLSHSSNVTTVEDGDPSLLHLSETQIEEPSSKLIVRDSGRSAVYNQLVASDCSVIQRALAKLISAKITKRDFVDSVFYSKKDSKGSVEDEATDAHIGDYSLTSAVRFQIASSHVTKCSKTFGRIGSFFLKASKVFSEPSSQYQSFDLKTTDMHSPIFRVFTSPLGSVSLGGAILSLDRNLNIKIDNISFENVVFNSTIEGNSSNRANPPLELAVWPLLIEFKRKYMEDILPIHEAVPQPSSLKFPIKFSSGNLKDNFDVPSDVLIKALTERLPDKQNLISELISAYKFVLSKGICGCSLSEVNDKSNDISTIPFSCLISDLLEAELIVKVGFAEERIVATCLAYSVWLMSSPPMFPWPWSNADGFVNWQSLRSLLSSVTFIILDWPAISKDSISKRLGSAISLVALEHLLRMLEDCGVVRKDYFIYDDSIEVENVGLFDEPRQVTVAEDCKSSIATAYWVKSDGLLKLGVLTCGISCRQYGDQLL